MTWSMTLYEVWPLTFFLLGITPYNMNIFCSLWCPLVRKTPENPWKNLFSKFRLLRGQMQMGEHGWGCHSLCFFMKFNSYLFCLLGITPHNINIFCSHRCPLVKKPRNASKKFFFWTYDAMVEQWWWLLFSFHKE